MGELQFAAWLILGIAAFLWGCEGLLRLAEWVRREIRVRRERLTWRR